MKFEDSSCVVVILVFVMGHHIQTELAHQGFKLLDGSFTGLEDQDGLVLLQLPFAVSDSQGLLLFADHHVLDCGGVGVVVKEGIEAFRAKITTKQVPNIDDALRGSFNRVVRLVISLGNGLGVLGQILPNKEKLSILHVGSDRAEGLLDFSH